MCDVALIKCMWKQRTPENVYFQIKTVKSHQSQMIGKDFLNRLHWELQIEALFEPRTLLRS